MSKGLLPFLWFSLCRVDGCVIQRPVHRFCKCEKAREHWPYQQGRCRTMCGCFFQVFCGVINFVVDAYYLTFCMWCYFCCASLCADFLSSLGHPLPKIRNLYSYLLLFYLCLLWGACVYLLPFLCIHLFILGTLSYFCN